MGLKYNAFISYRHSEVDSKIASEVQTRLERFRIPKAIIKKTGVKRIERIFRDKEELPITSDLNEDIDQALENSDKLIVICSTRTGESIWVRKEIETFLKYHDKKDVFTVLVDGEPEQVIPDILLHDTVSEYLPSGKLETKDVMIEPLSCDYRIDIKRARKYELPRLAAAIIGCSYDELVQRRKQYIRRRNSIIGSCAAIAIAAIIGYLTWSLLQIKMNYDRAESNYALAQNNLALAEENYAQAQENYMDALRNQSTYLASESGELLDSGDRLGAVQLALAALPSEDKDRPVTCEAEYALSSALGLYLAPGVAESAVVWNYGSGNRIEKFRVDYKNMRVACLDSLGNLNIWSLNDHTLLQTFISEDSKLTNFVVDSEGRVILAYKDMVRVMDNDLETELWNMPWDEAFSSFSSFESFRISDDGSEFLYFTHEILVVLDLMTGETKLQYDMNDIIENTDDYLWGIGISKAIFSPDGSKIAIVYTYGIDSKGIIVYDRETLEWNTIGDGYTYVPDISFTPDSKALIFTYEDDITGNSLDFSGIQILRETNRMIECHDAESGKLLWIDGVPHTLVGYDSGMMFVKYGLGEDLSDAVAVNFSNKCVIIELQTGKILSERELASEYIDAYQNESKTRLYLILRNGQYAIIKLDDPDNGTVVQTYFEEGVEDSAAFIGTEGSAHYLIECTDSNYLTEYSSFFYDRSYNAIPETGSGGIASSFVSGKRLLALDKEMNLYCVDMNAGNVVWTSQVEGGSYVSVSFIGSDEFGNVYLVNSNSISGEYGDKLFKVDIATGDITRVTDLPDMYTINTDYLDGCIYFSCSGGYSEPAYIYKYDTSDGSGEKIELKTDEDGYFPTCKLNVSPDGKHAHMLDQFNSNGITYLTNLETGAMITLDINGETFAAWSPDSEWVAVSNGERVNVYEADGPKILELSDFETTINDLFVCEKGLVVLLNNGMVGLYDTTGNILASLDAFHGYRGLSLVNYEDVTFEIIDDILIINRDVYSSLIYLDEFKVKNILIGLLAYDKDSEKYYVNIFGDVGGAGSMGYFKVKSIDELIAEGMEFIGDATMSADMKKRYGIEDT